MFSKQKIEYAPELSVLFVCLGNICRSPTAEGVFRAAVEKAGLAKTIRVESAGLGSWLGSPPDPRAIQAAAKRGYELAKLRSRQVDVQDFAKFGWILAMDNSVMKRLLALQPADFTGHLGLLLDFAPELGVREIPDPYFGTPAGFDRVLDLVEASTRGLLTRIQPTESGR